MKKLFTLYILLTSCLVLAQHKKLKVEPNHSTVGFNIAIAGFTKVTGKFTDYEILMDWDEEDLNASQISTSIQVKSINTGIPDRDTHLQSPDFFDAEKYPEITFKSDSIQRIDYSNFKAYGQLNMHGITKAYILPFQIIKIENNTIGIRSQTTLKRSDYGVASDFKHTSLPDFLSDTIEIEIDFWTRKRKE